MLKSVSIMTTEDRIAIDNIRVSINCSKNGLLSPQQIDD